MLYRVPRVSPGPGSHSTHSPLTPGPVASLSYAGPLFLTDHCRVLVPGMYVYYYKTYEKAVSERGGRGKREDMC